MSDYRKRLESVVRNIREIGDGPGCQCRNCMETRHWENLEVSQTAEQIDREIGYSAACEALEGVIRMADRSTVEFDAARAALRVARGEENLNGG